MRRFTRRRCRCRCGCGCEWSAKTCWYSGTHAQSGKAQSSFSQATSLFAETNISCQLTSHGQQHALIRANSSVFTNPSSNFHPGFDLRQTRQHNLQLRTAAVSLTISLRHSHIVPAAARVGLSRGNKGAWQSPCKDACRFQA